MAGADIPDALRDLVHERAKGRCEYCQTSEALSGIACQIDHIIPRALQGPTTSDNLCLACAPCNGRKYSRTQARDPVSGDEVPLFHPRRQSWNEHFAWSANGIEIVGRTPTGRATIAALKMNDPLIVGARSLWSDLGLHPPAEE